MTEKLPKGWKRCLISEIAEIVSGGTPSSKDLSNFADSTGIPWITPADLSGYKDKFIAAGKRFLSEKGLKCSSARVLPAGTVLFTSRAPVGYVAIAANPVATNQGFKSFVIKSEVLSEYLYYYLKSQKEAIESLASGTTFLELSGGNAKKITVVLPPIDEQKRIVARLDQLLARVDSCRAHLDRAAAAIKRFRQSVLNAAVTGQLLFETFSSATVEIANMFMDYKLPEIPSTWSWTKFSDVATVVTNLKTPDDYPEYPHIAPNHIESNSGRLLPIKTVKEDKVISPNHLFSADSIIYSKIRPYLCKAVVVDFEGLCSADIYPIKTTLNIKFLHMWILSSYFTKYASQNQSRVVLPKINQTALYKLPVPMPTSEDQKAIVEKAEAMLTYADSIESKLTAARERVDNLTASILAKAFRGELV